MRYKYISIVHLEFTKKGLATRFRRREGRFNMKTFICYHRISNAKSGGLDSYSIEAQQEITARFVASENGQILASFCEVESGRYTDEFRPELAKAISLAKSTKST